MRVRPARYAHPMPRVWPASITAYRIMGKPRTHFRPANTRSAGMAVRGGASLPAGPCGSSSLRSAKSVMGRSHPHWERRPPRRHLCVRADGDVGVPHAMETDPLPVIRSDRNAKDHDGLFSAAVIMLYGIPYKPSGQREQENDAEANARAAAQLPIFDTDVPVNFSRRQSRVAGELARRSSRESKLRSSIC